MKFEENPFKLDFGSKPKLYISRKSEEEKILKTFMADNPSSHLYLIIGARGMGKTVLMTSISEKIKQNDEWIHIDLDSESDIMSNFYYQLKKKTAKRMSNMVPKEVSASVTLGASASLTWSNSDEERVDVRYEIDELLASLKGKKVLITIDEAVNSANMREFASYYQHCLRENLPLFVLMTGLFKNIRALQNNRSLTFLRRATRIDLKPLSSIRIATEFEKVLGVSEEEAIKLSKLTCGYSYAFQMLGHLLFDSETKRLSDDIYMEYKSELFDNSYEKIWEELSEKERDIIRVIASDKDGVPVSMIKEELNMDNNSFSTYRDVLIKSGLIENTSYGNVALCLPLFDEYVRNYY